MRKMHSNKDFKPRLVSSGEYDSSNHRYVLDNPLELNKNYLVIMVADDGVDNTSVMLSTIAPLSSIEGCSTVCYGIDSTTLTYLYFNKEQPTYLTEEVIGSDYDSDSGYTVYVYELYGVSGV